MKKIFHLGTCSTCKAILKGISIDATCELQDIKTDHISAKDLDWLKERVGSYEALFSKRALKFRELGLHLRQLSEADYRNFILSEYTFLKRPVIINGKKIYVGSEKKTVAKLKAEWR